MKTSDTTKIKRFIKQLEKNKLCVLDKSIVDIQEKLSHENINFDILSKIINLDPMCLANFIACANTYKEKIAPDIEEQLESPKHASMMLGLDNIEACVADFSPLSSYEDKAVAAKIEQIAYRSLHTAHQAQHLAKLIGSRNGDEIFNSALFSSLPELMIWSVSPTKAQRYETLIFEDEENIEDSQIKIFGFYFKDLLEQLSLQWHFPELFLQANATDVIDDARKNIICIKLADKLCRLVDFGWYYQEFEDFYEYASMISHLDISRLNRAFHQTAVNLARETELLYQYHFPANYLLLPLVKLPYIPVIIFETEKVKEQTPVQEEHKQYIHQPIEPIHEDLSTKIESSNSIPTLIQLTMNSLFNIEGIQNIYLLMLDKEHTALTVRIEKTLSDNSRLDYHVPINQEDNVFARLVEIPQLLYFSNTLLKKTATLITPEIESLVLMQPFCVKSIFHQGKPIGIFCASSEIGITEQANKEFRNLMVRFDQHLTRIT